MCQVLDAVVLVKNAGMMSFLRSNKDFERDNIRKLREEIEVLGFSNPVLVTFGKDAEKIAKRNLGKDFQIVGIPHYANYISKENYRAQVCGQLSRMTINKNAEQGAPPDRYSAALHSGR